MNASGINAKDCCSSRKYDILDHLLWSKYYMTQVLYRYRVETYSVGRLHKVIWITHLQQKEKPSYWVYAPGGKIKFYTLSTQTAYASNV